MLATAEHRVHNLRLGWNDEQESRLLPRVVLVCDLQNVFAYVPSNLARYLGQQTQGLVRIYPASDIRRLALSSTSAARQRGRLSQENT